MLEVSASFLSLVLSNHYQRDEVNRIIAGTDVDFGVVRNATFKYSRTAEFNFFKRSSMAYFFIQFAKGSHGQAYMKSKCTLTDRIIAEIDMMAADALKILKGNFEQKLNKYCVDA